MGQTGQNRTLWDQVDSQLENKVSVYVHFDSLFSVTEENITRCDRTEPAFRGNWVEVLTISEGSEPLLVSIKTC